MNWLDSCGIRQRPVTKLFANGWSALSCGSNLRIQSVEVPMVLLVKNHVVYSLVMWYHVFSFIYIIIYSVYHSIYIIIYIMDIYRRLSHSFPIKSSI